MDGRMDSQSFRDVQSTLQQHVKQYWPYSAQALQTHLASTGYFLDETTCRKLVLYLSIGKPLGLRGEPGVGKSELAWRICQLLNASFVDIECHSQLEVADVGVSWNSFKQIVDAQTGKLQSDAFTLPYLNHTPLLTSVMSDEPVVVRIDEVDKLNEHTSNFFLRFLDKQELVVHDLSESENILHAKAPMYIFLTSNEYRPLDSALMRRIAWVELHFPQMPQLTQIVTQKTGIPIAMADRISYLVAKLRELPLRKKPSISEVLDFTQALILETDGHLTRDSIRVTLGLLLKYAEDEEQGWEAMETWLA